MKYVMFYLLICWLFIAHYYFTCRMVKAQQALTDSQMIITRDIMMHEFETAWRRGYLSSKELKPWQQWHSDSVAYQGFLGTQFKAQK